MILSEIQSQIDIKHLCEIEQSVILNMFHSKEHFNEIIQKLDADDFTFVVHNKVFEHLKEYANKVEFFGVEKEIVRIAADLLKHIEGLTIIKLLNKKNYSKNLASDIDEIIAFSKYRKSVIEQNIKDGTVPTQKIEINDEYGKYIAIYFNYVIKHIYTTYIFHLPDELCDVFKQTLDNLSLCAQKEDHKLSVSYIRDKETKLPTQLQGFTLNKNISKIEKAEKLIEWATYLNISNIDFPRNRRFLSEYMFFLNLDNNNITYIPDDLFDLIRNSLFIDLSDNKLKALPKNISNLNVCKALMLCNNNITSLNDELFEMQLLSTLCLHNNKLTKIPNKIQDLINLETLTISNNDIKRLPSGISKLKKLNKLDIENTLIKEDTLKYINLEQIEKISFDDDLLPYFVKNFHKLKNINTINLVHSKYTQEDGIISLLNLTYDDEKLIKDNDYKGKGCIVLSKKI